MEGESSFYGGGYGGGSGGYGGGYQQEAAYGGKGGYGMNSGNTNFSPAKGSAAPSAGFFSSPSGVNSGAMSQGTPRQQMLNEKTLLPVTILQLKNASSSADNKFTVDGQELSTIKFVGAIMNVQVQSTNIQYTIDDSTGTIDVKVWLGDDEDDPDASRQRSELVEGKYVRVFGKLQDYNGNRSISAYSMSPLSDYNEIAKHFAMVMLTHLKSTRGEPAVMDKKVPIGSMNAPAANYGANTASSGIPQDDSATAHMSPVQRAVLHFYASSHGSIEGISRSAVAQGLPQFNRKEIFDTIEYLSSEGHLYTTLDDEHYRCTSRGT